MARVIGLMRYYGAERCLDQARADLTHLIAAIAIFEAKGGHYYEAEAWDVFSNIYAGMSGGPRA
jgi:hypothetical protein